MIVFKRDHQALINPVAAGAPINKSTLKCLWLEPELDRAVFFEFAQAGSGPTVDKVVDTIEVKRMTLGTLNERGAVDLSVMAVPAGVLDRLAASFVKGPVGDQVWARCTSGAREQQAAEGEDQCPGDAEPSHGCISPLGVESRCLRPTVAGGRWEVQGPRHRWFADTIIGKGAVVGNQRSKSQVLKGTFEKPGLKKYCERGSQLPSAGSPVQVALCR